MAPHPSTGSSPIDEPRAAGPVRLAAVAFGSLAFAIALGAFGAHGLKAVLPADRLLSYETASRYHFYSSFFLAALAALRLAVPSLSDNARIVWAQRAWGYGSLLFCGSVYLVSVRGIIGMESASWLGAVAPVGGFLLIVGAGMAALALWRSTGV